MRNGYAVVYEWAGTNYSAYVSDLPGCVKSGRTLAIVKLNIKEAIAGHVKTMQEFGEAVPEPKTRVGNVQVPA